MAFTIHFVVYSVKRKSKGNTIFTSIITGFQTKEKLSVKSQCEFFFSFEACLADKINNIQKKKKKVFHFCINSNSEFFCVWVGTEVTIYIHG